jgi:hypothetical protein
VSDISILIFNFSRGILTTKSAKFKHLESDRNVRRTLNLSSLNLVGKIVFHDVIFFSFIFNIFFKAISNAVMHKSDESGNPDNK